MRKAEKSVWELSAKARDKWGPVGSCRAALIAYLIKFLTHLRCYTKQLFIKN